MDPKIAHLTEEEFLQALNPRGKTLEGYQPLYAADIEDYSSRAGSRIGKSVATDGRIIHLWAGDDVFLWAMVEGQVAGFMGEHEDFVEIQTAQEFQGIGVGRVLFRSFLERYGIRDMGGFTAAGEALARSVHRDILRGPMQDDLPTRAVKPQRPR